MLGVIGKGLHCRRLSGRDGRLDLVSFAIDFEDQTHTLFVGVNKSLALGLFGCKWLNAQINALYLVEWTSIIVDGLDRLGGASLVGQDASEVLGQRGDIVNTFALLWSGESLDALENDRRAGVVADGKVLGNHGAVYAVYQGSEELEFVGKYRMGWFERDLVQIAGMVIIRREEEKTRGKERRESE